MRLGSVPKAGLIYQRQTLLERTVTALRHARRIVVVGDTDPRSLPGQVLTTREDPPYGGPAAGIAAGAAVLAASDPAPSDYTIVLACDMPRVEAATAKLLELLPENSSADGVIAVDGEQRRQPLAAVYKTAKLAAALSAQRRSGELGGLSAFRLIAGLDLAPVTVPPGSTDDIDTWEDAAKFGMKTPAVDTTPALDTIRGEAMNDRPENSRAEEDEILRQWCRRLADALEVPDLEVDLKSLLGLAGRAAHGVLRPAAPLTTFIVGYAAGLAVASGKADADSAIRSATDVGFQLCREAAESSPAHEA